ncbi:MAG TPA: phosphotransferase [Myxococcaceae bacterium]|nr:phosphotransferase [Myxococcaceae bacterium]
MNPKNVETLLREQVEKATGESAATAPVQPLVAQASAARSYFRVGTPPKSHVCMLMTEDGQKSEEIGKGGASTELPFLNVHRYLEALGVRVPHILRYDAEARTMVIEDLTDQTFEKALASGHSREDLYGRAIDLLARLRVEAEKNPDPACIAFGRSFDVDLYDWELHHFREWGLEVWSGRKPDETTRAELDRQFRAIAESLADAPTGFTHRDYQSRNIMVKDGELVVIDFQDALLGPRQYDLVALLRDSYIELDEGFVDAMLDRYVQAFEAAGGEAIEVGPFKAYFHLLTVQRKLKDAGRFEFIHRVRGNPGFLPSIPASLRYVKAAFRHRPELAPLQALLADFVPELGA